MRFILPTVDYVRQLYLLNVRISEIQSRIVQIQWERQVLTAKKVALQEVKQPDIVPSAIHVFEPVELKPSVSLIEKRKTRVSGDQGTPVELKDMFLVLALKAETRLNARNKNAAVACLTAMKEIQDRIQDSECEAIYKKIDIKILQTKV